MLTTLHSLPKLPHIISKGRTFQQLHATSNQHSPPTRCMPAAPIQVPSGPWCVEDGGITLPEGFSAAGVCANLRESQSKPDLSLVFCDAPAVSAGVFTQNVVCAAPVTYCKSLLSNKKTARAILMNAGQANAVTGSQGDKDALACAVAVSEELGITPADVLLLSTGVIGQRIKMDHLLEGVPKLVAQLGTSPENSLQASEAITTTDLASKSTALSLDIDGVQVHLGGTCKGSGMIHPNMATMLGVITCDAPVDAGVWQSMLVNATRKSFNMISVDGDTSTNDTVLALSSCRAKIPQICDLTSSSGKQLQQGLDAIMQGLAKSIAWDGEGATCMIEVVVDGASDENEAIVVAKSIAGSMLVKSAVFGHDPNWGRIACAAGYSGVDFLPNLLRISIGPFQLLECGAPMAFDRDAVSSYLKANCDAHETVDISVSVGTGPGKATAWGCDLSYDYVKINAEYTT